MKKNIGNVDMVIRLVFAALLILFYFLIDFKPLTGLIVLVIAVLLGVTAFTRVCPLYYVFRTDTLKKEKKE